MVYISEINLGENDLDLLHLLLYKLSNYHPGKVLNIDSMCLIAIGKTNTKIKVMPRDFSFHAILVKLFVSDKERMYTSVKG